MENTSMPDLYTLNFIYPDKILYECIKCGICCNNYWELPVDKTSVDKLNSDDEFKNLQITQKNSGAFSESKIIPGQYCLKTKDSNCIFLDLQKICLLHKNLGGHKKPQTCIDYPFSYIITPDGIQVVPSFACSSILKEVGSPLSTYTNYFKENIKSNKKIFELKKPIKLSERLEISFDVYKKIERGLLDFLNVEVYSVDDRLVGGSIYLNLLEEFIIEASKDPSNSPEIIVDAFIDNIQKQNYARVIRIAQKPNFSNLYQKLILGVMTHFRNNIKLKSGAFSTLIEILLKYFKIYLKIGKVFVLPLSVKYSFNDFSTVRFIKEEPYLIYQMVRYVKHLIETKQAIQNTSFIKGYNYLLFFTAVIRWYCVGLAVERNSLDIEREDVTTAIEWTEKYYGFNTLFFDMLDAYPVLTDTFNRAFDSKKYASSMVKGNKR